MMEKLNSAELVNENTIWNVRQNHPALIVNDCIREFGLNEEQAEKLRYILMLRGVNKWLLCRREFIKLKHKVKEMLKEEARKGYGKNKEKIKVLQFVNVEMQRIAKMPRYVIWGRRPHRNMKNNEKEIIIKGKHC